MLLVGKSPRAVDQCGLQNASFHCLGIDSVSKRFSSFSWEVFHSNSAHEYCDLAILHEFAFQINLWHLEFVTLWKRYTDTEWISSTVALTGVGKIDSWLWEARRGLFREAIWTDLVGRVILLDISVMTAEDMLKHEVEKEKTVVRPTTRWNHSTYDSCWQHDITVLKLSTDLEY